MMAEGRLYPFTYAVFDRQMSGVMPTMEHVRGMFPDTLKFLAYKNIDDRYMLSYFPEFTRRDAIRELPGWKIYAK